MVIIDKNQHGTDTLKKLINQNKTTILLVNQRDDISNFIFDGKQVYCICAEDFAKSIENINFHVPEKHKKVKKDSYFSKTLMEKSFLLLSDDEKNCLELAVIAAKDKLFTENTKVLCLSGYTLVSLEIAKHLLDIKHFETLCRPYK